MHFSGYNENQATFSLKLFEMIIFTNFYLIRKNSVHVTRKNTLAPVDSPVRLRK